MKITVLAGGVGGAKFLLGVKRHLGWEPYGPARAVGATDAAGETSSTGDSVTAIVNTGDDIRLHGLQVCPDLDSCLYTLSGEADTERGWGRREETWTVQTELRGYGAEAPWFSLGDKDIATHLMRTRMLDAGYRLSDVTAALSDRWGPGVRLLPMTDDRVETHVVVDSVVNGPVVDTPDHGGVDPAQNPARAAERAARNPAGDLATPAAGEAPGEQRPDFSRPADTGSAPVPERVALHFQEWWVRYRAELPPRAITPIGADAAAPAPGVLDAIAGADLLLIAPSNPVVSVGIVLAVPGIAEAIRSAAAPVVAVSPLIGGAPVRGYADKCLAAIGVPATAEGVGRHYGARADGGLLDGYLIADGDTADVPGVRVGTAPLLMRDPDATAEMVAACRKLVSG